MRYLGLDLGTKTCGVALSDKTKIIASFYKNINYKEEDVLIKEICEIAEQEEVEKIILGFPKNMNNTIGERGEMVLSFKEKLSRNTLFESKESSVWININNIEISENNTILHIEKTLPFEKYNLVSLFLACLLILTSVNSISFTFSSILLNGINPSLNCLISFICLFLNASFNIALSSFESVFPNGR